MKEAKCKKYEM